MFRNKKIITILSIMIFLAVLIIIQMFTDILHGIVFLLPFLIFFLLGIFLIIITIKQKIKPKTFLLLTGISASGIFISIILHNLFYALTIVTENILILNTLMEILHVIFFIAAVIVCPIGFFVFAVISLILLVKNLIIGQQS